MSGNGNRYARVRAPSAPPLARKIGLSGVSDVMRTFSFICALTIITALPASAKVNSTLAKRCHQMSLQAHPSGLPDTRAVAALRRSYYRLCIQRRGDMDPELGVR